MGYYSKRRNEWGRNPRAEKAIAVVMLVVIVVLLAVFLLVYHDLPLRIS